MDSTHPKLSKTVLRCSGSVLVVLFYFQNTVFLYEKYSTTGVNVCVVVPERLALRGQVAEDVHVDEGERGWAGAVDVVDAAGASILGWSVASLLVICCNGPDNIVTGYAK